MRCLSPLLPLVLAGCEFLNCDRHPILAIADNEACILGEADCVLQVGVQKRVILWGQTCDNSYPLEILDVHLKSELATWVIEYDATYQASGVALAPHESGWLDLRLTYAWQNGTREFEAELQVLD